MDLNAMREARLRRFQQQQQQYTHRPDRRESPPPSHGHDDRDRDRDRDRAHDDDRDREQQQLRRRLDAARRHATEQHFMYEASGAADAASDVWQEAQRQAAAERAQAHREEEQRHEAEAARRRQSEFVRQGAKEFLQRYFEEQEAARRAEEEAAKQRAEEEAARRAQEEYEDREQAARRARYYKEQEAEEAARRARYYEEQEAERRAEEEARERRNAQRRQRRAGKKAAAGDGDGPQPAAPQFDAAERANMRQYVRLREFGEEVETLQRAYALLAAQGFVDHVPIAVTRLQDSRTVSAALAAADAVQADDIRRKRAQFLRANVTNAASMHGVAGGADPDFVRVAQAFNTLDNFPGLVHSARTPRGVAGGRRHVWVHAHLG